MTTLHRLRPHAFILVAASLAGAAANLAQAETVRWKGGKINNYWENRDNWDKKRVPGDTDDVVIPGDKGDIVIAKDHDLQAGVPVAKPKKLKSLTFEKSTAVDNRTRLTTTATHAGMPAPLSSIPVNVTIETSGDIVIGKYTKIAPAWGNPIAAFGVPGGSISLKSTGGAITIEDFAELEGGNGATGVSPQNVGLPRGPGGGVELKAKKSIDIKEAYLYGGAVVAAGGVGAATSGGILIDAEENVTIAGVVVAGLTMEGVGGSTSITAGKKLTTKTTAHIKSGFSANKGNHTAGGLALVSGALMTLEGEIIARDGPVAGNVIISAQDLDNKTTVQAGDSLKDNTPGGNMFVTIKAAKPTRVGELTAGKGKPDGSVTVNGKKIALADPIRGGSILVRSTGDVGTAPEIVLLDGAQLDAEALVCLDAGGGSIDFSLLSDDAAVIAVSDPAGFVNLAGEVELSQSQGDTNSALDQLIDGAFGLGDGGCVPESCLADIDLDGVVDEWDLAFLLALWDTNASIADLDGDGNVGASDLSLLLAAWGACG